MEAAEFELKFEISDEALPQIAEQLGLPAVSQTRQVRSTYFDTPERDLRNACLGLRVRQTDAGMVQNLKREGHFAAFVRHEWETQLRSDRPDAAALANTPAGDVLNGNGKSLEAVFTTTVQRTRHVWTKGNDTVEVSLDRGEITSGTRREPIQELELELKTGDPKAVFELANRLSKLAMLPLMFESKADRGYHLADDHGWQPERARPIVIPPVTPAGDAFREIGHTCLAQVVNNAKLVSRHRSLEALHQMRVGLRRFRAALTTFRPFIEDGEYGHVAAETKWLASELDAARDIDVFIQEDFCSVSPERADREAFARLGTQLLHAQSRAYDRALTVLASLRFARFVLTTTRWLEIGAWTRSDEPVIRRLRDGRTDEFAHDQLDHMRRQVRRRGRHLAALDAESRHRLRIKAKKLRYAADFFSGTFGRAKQRKRFVKALGDLQDALGRIHDTNVAPQLALNVAGGRSTKAGFAAGLIVANRRASTARSEREALKAYEKFVAAKWFWG